MKTLLTDTTLAENINKTNTIPTEQQKHIKLLKKHFQKSIPSHLKSGVNSNQFN